MIQQTFSYLFLFTFLFINYFVISQYHGAPIVMNSNQNFANLFPQIKNYSSWINRGKNIGKL